MSESLSFPYQAHIPYNVLADTKLCPNAKIHFGCLSGLSVKEGYCWATNEQLAEMHGVAVIQIKKWLDQLEASGFIKRETINTTYRNEEGKLLWKKRRRIYIGDAYSRKDTDRYENEPSANNFKNFTEMGEESPKTDKKQDDCGRSPDPENSKNVSDRYEKSPIDDRYEKSPIRAKSLKSKSDDDDSAREGAILSDRKHANSKTVHDLAGRERTVTKDDLQKAALPLTESTAPPILRRAIDETWTQILYIDYPISDPFKYMQTVLNQKLEQLSKPQKETKCNNNKTRKPYQKQPYSSKSACNGNRPTSAPSSHRPLSEILSSMENREKESANGQKTQ